MVIEALEWSNGAHGWIGQFIVRAAQQQEGMAKRRVRCCVYHQDRPGIPPVCRQNMDVARTASCRFVIPEDKSSGGFGT
ncbi:MAG: hypothetical protein JRG73_18330 [Deltaproteobacteria bacterium]|nr:hypothetical protein [Deltaproteobacteria bacterium]